MSTPPTHQFEIRDEGHYDEALRRLDVIFFAEQGTPEGDELDMLVDAVVRYEDIHYPISEPVAATTTRDFRLELALLPQHLRSVACTQAGVVHDLDWTGVEASEAAFEAAEKAGRDNELEEAVRALADFCGLETVTFEESDLDVPNGFPWYAGSLSDGDGVLPSERQSPERPNDPASDAEALAARMQRRSEVTREAALDWIESRVIPAYGMTAAQVMRDHGLGEMLDFMDALDADT
jgi:HTH-type transcriptional regulator/antitoxin HigA